MNQAIVLSRNGSLARAGMDSLPAVIADAGERASKRFIEFFTANIRNKNTRMAYACAVSAFLAWCEEHGFAFDDIEAVTVSTYIEQLLARRAWRSQASSSISLPSVCFSTGW